jgi:cellulose synthase/poly-beta-1,6-N-acetylglucosamine synthase-like glycosyltransferase
MSAAASDAPHPAAAGVITCLIPTFNRKRLLSRAIASAMLQDCPGMRIHVFDNHSSDGTADWLASLKQRDARLDFTCQESNIGAFDNFLAAFASVATPYFSILSDDDLLLPGFYRAAVAYLEKHPECGLYCGDTLHASERGAVRYSSNHNWSSGFHPAGRAYQEIKRRGHPTWTGIVFRREVLQQVVLRDNAGSPTDVDFELQAALRFGIYISRQPSAVLTMSAITASSNKPLSWVIPCWDDFMRRHCPGYGGARSREVLFLSDRYLADILSLLNQDHLDGRDRGLILTALREHRYWSGLGNRLMVWQLIHGGGVTSRAHRVAALARKLLKVVEQPRLLLNFLKLRRYQRAFQRLQLFA